MSYESYRERLKANGGNVVDSTKLTTKRSQVKEITTSPLRADVYLNLDEADRHMCIPRDVNTYEIRKFLFTPDTKIYKGDYIGFDGFTYLVIGANTSDTHPLATAQLCNFNIPVKTETVVNYSINSIVERESNGRPIYPSQTITTTKPCVMTAKIYSTADNSSVPLPDGSMSVLLPYIANDPLPELNQKITYEQSQYKVTDLIYQNVVSFGEVKKGYVEIRLQREANTNV